MSKFLVQGRDAGQVLNYISANEVNGKVNQITYTQWLNPRGTLEADLTVTKLGRGPLHGGGGRHDAPPCADLAQAQHPGVRRIVS